MKKEPYVAIVCSRSTNKTIHKNYTGLSWFSLLLNSRFLLHILQQTEVCVWLFIGISTVLRLHHTQYTKCLLFLTFNLVFLLRGRESSAVAGNTFRIIRKWIVKRIKRVYCNRFNESENQIATEWNCNQFSVTTKP